MQTKLRHTVAALMLLGPIAATVPFGAQAQVSRAPMVQGLQLRADTGLSQGSTLHFTVQGTPYARADVRINDTGIVVPLRETSPGTYMGTHTIGPGERIDANGLLRVSVLSGPLSNTANYTFPQSFIAWQNDNRNDRRPPVAALPRIERFAAMTDGPLEPGAQVRFVLRGAPGGNANMTIPGLARNIDLDEVRPGVYRGSYTVRRDDNLRGLSSAAAMLRFGDQSVTTNLTEPLAAGRFPGTDSMGAAPMTLQPSVVSHSNNDAVASDVTTIRGRTAPNATVRVRVDAVPPQMGQRIGVAQQILFDTVQADAQGNFSFDFNARTLPVPGTRIEVSMTATSGSQSAETRLILMNRG